MTPVARMINLFLAPKDLFTDLSSRHNWRDSLLPLTLLVMMSLISLAIMKDIYLEEQLSQTIERIEESSRIPEDQKEEYILDTVDRFEHPGVVAQILMWSVNALALPLRVVFMTIILYVIGNFVFGGEVAFGGLLPVTAHAYLVSILEMAVKVPIMWSKGSAEIYTGLGMLGIGEPGSFLSYFLAGLDFFGGWRIFLLALGMGVVYKRGTKPFILALGTYWILQIALIAGLGALFY